jgi:hypothetical protein
MQTVEPVVRRIDIAKDFSPILGPRSKSRGPHSGELFLETVLEPAFLEADLVVISLDEIELPSASFFEEAFGGLVRKYGLTRVEEKVRFNAVRRAYLLPKIKSWMHRAAEAR